MNLRVLASSLALFVFVPVLSAHADTTYVIDQQFPDFSITGYIGTSGVTGSPTPFDYYVGGFDLVLTADGNSVEINGNNFSYLIADNPGNGDTVTADGLFAFFGSGASELEYGDTAGDYFCIGGICPAGGETVHIAGVGSFTEPISTPSYEFSGLQSTATPEPPAGLLLATGVTVLLGFNGISRRKSAFLGQR